MRLTLCFIVILFHCIVAAQTAQADEVLPSWNNTGPKKAIIEFVKSVTDPNSKSFVKASDRIATFDNDGTLWAEQPMYFQLIFALDQLKKNADKHPEWKQKQPFKAALEGDMKTVLAGGEHALLEIVMATHAGMTAEEFADAVAEWVKTARHEKSKRPYTEMVYQPMLELLTYLRANGFKTYLVSGGGIEFMRVFAEEVYGVPPEQVIGSSIKTKFEMRAGVPVLVRLPELNFNDDKGNKPVGINHHIGRKPIMAFGNSDGDLQMLQWVDSRKGKSFAGYIHHTDEIREWAYDRDSHIGRLDKGLAEAKEKGWSVINMKQDWKVVFPFEK